MRPLSSFLFLLLLYSALPCRADFTASVRSTHITEVDTLQLTLRWAGTDPRDSDAQPDFSPLRKDFEILGARTSAGSTISSGTGRRQLRSTYFDWILSLRPMRTGRITIPPIRYENWVSNPVVINVSKLSSAAKQRIDALAFLITSVDRQQVFVQSQLIYTIKFYYRNDYDGNLPTAPEIKDALVKTLVEKNTHQSNINGIRYFVAEWRYAIFPQKSGELIIEKEVIKGAIKVQEGGLWRRSRYQSVRSQSEGHRITVKPKPAAFTSPIWLPAKSFTLTETWTSNPPVFTVGEPINRTITVMAQGIPVSLLAPLATQEIENAKVYSDPAEVDESFNEQGIIASRTETIGIVPTAAGDLHFPEIRIDWWNTDRDRLEVVRIPAASYSVLPAPLGESNPFQPNIIEQPIELQPAETQQPLSRNYWLYLAAALAAALTLTTTQWLRTRRELYRVRQRFEEEPLNGHIEIQSESETYKEFKHACRASDPIATRASLLNWARIHWAEHNIRGLHDLKQFDPDGHLTQAVTNLDQCLFSPNNQQSWDGEMLLEIVDQLRSTQREKKKRTRSVIPSLYPA